MTTHGEALRALSENRELYLIQSQRTLNGVVAPFPGAVRPAPTQSPRGGGSTYTHSPAPAGEGI